jgi:hypothetical protein
MKNFKNVFLIMCLSVLISCGGSDDDLGLSGEGSLTAKVAGTSFTSLPVSVSAAITNGIAAIQGSNSSGEVIRINIASYSGVGTYKTGDAISNLNSLSYGTISPVAFWTSTFDIGSGTIEITEDTATMVSGTFSFTGYNGASNTKQVTEGKFNAPKN